MVCATVFNARTRRALSPVALFRSRGMLLEGETMKHLSPLGGFFSSLASRARAGRAPRFKERAEAFSNETKKRRALEAEERVVLHIWEKKVLEAPVNPGDCKAFQSAYLSLCQRRAALPEPERGANAELALAYERACRELDGKSD